MPLPLSPLPSGLAPLSGHTPETPAPANAQAHQMLADYASQEAPKLNAAKSHTDRAYKRWQSENLSLSQLIYTLEDRLQHALDSPEPEKLITEVINQRIARHPEHAAHLQTINRTELQRALADCLSSHLNRLTHPDPAISAAARQQCHAGLMSALRRALPRNLHTELAAIGILANLLLLAAIGRRAIADAQQTCPAGAHAQLTDILAPLLTLLGMRLLAAQQLHDARPRYQQLATLAPVHSELANTLTERYRQLPVTQSVGQQRQRIHQFLGAGQSRLNTLRHPLEEPRLAPEKLLHTTRNVRRDLTAEDPDFRQKMRHESHRLHRELAAHNRAQNKASKASDQPPLAPHHPARLMPMAKKSLPDTLEHHVGKIDAELRHWLHHPLTRREPATYLTDAHLLLALTDVARQARTPGDHLIDHAFPLGRVMHKDRFGNTHLLPARQSQVSVRRGRDGELEITRIRPHAKPARAAGTAPTTPTANS